MNYIRYYVGALGSVVVMALCYKPEGRGFDNIEYQKHKNNNNVSGE
jgi:hypothetical protein